MLAFLLITQLVLLVLFELIMPSFMLVFAPGFSDEPMKYDLAVLFTRITFPYLLFISLVSLMGAVLNSVERFAAAAAAPILLNLCLIAALVVLTPCADGRPRACLGRDGGRHRAVPVSRVGLPPRRHVDESAGCRA